MDAGGIISIVVCAGGLIAFAYLIARVLTRILYPEFRPKPFDYGTDRDSFTDSLLDHHLAGGKRE